MRVVALGSGFGGPYTAWHLERFAPTSTIAAAMTTTGTATRTPTMRTPTMQMTVTIALLGAAITAGLPAAGAAQQTPAAGQSPAVYVAQLHPLNAKVTSGRASGEARFTIKGDSLTIAVRVQGVAPDMVHLQHFHGFEDGRQATCATAGADKNGDGIIDLIETEPMSGTTMVPFTADPVSMEIVTDTYPKALAGGTYEYEKTVSLSALQDAFGKKFGGQQIQLGRRVVYIHGVPSGTTLPASVASLGTIPAQVTLPIACGEIKRLK